MKKLLLTMASLLSLGMLMAQTDLFISEYVEGSGNSKAIEIYNPTANAISLTNYYVARFSNGSTGYSGGGITQLSGTIQPYSVFILVNGQTTSTSTSPACSPVLQGLIVPNGGSIPGMMDIPYPAPTYMNGNDAIAIMKDINGDGTPELPVDLFGQTGLLGTIEAETGWSNIKDTLVTYHVKVINGTDTTWVEVQSTIANYIVKAKDNTGQYYGPFWMCWTKDHTLKRKPNVVDGVKTNPTTGFSVSVQWDTLPGGEDIWTDLGHHDCVADPNYHSVATIKNTFISVYPNPAQDVINLVSNYPVEKIEILNITGQVIRQISDVSGNIISISDNNLKPGVYLVKVYTNNHQTAIQKLLIE